MTYWPMLEPSRRRPLQFASSRQSNKDREGTKRLWLVSPLDEPRNLILIPVSYWQYWCSWQWGARQPRLFAVSAGLAEVDFLQMKDELHKLGFLSICTPFDEKSVDMVEKHGFEIIKIASCSLTDWPLLERIAATGLPLIASTAGATIEECLDLGIFRVVELADFLRPFGRMTLCATTGPANGPRPTSSIQQVPEILGYKLPSHSGAWFQRRLSSATSAWIAFLRWKMAFCTPLLLSASSLSNVGRLSQLHLPS